MATSAPDRASRAGGQARLRRRGLAVGLALLPLVTVGACSTSPAPPRPVERAPRVVAAETVGPRMRDLVIDSPALDQHVRVRLLLPRRFEAEPGRRWPVLWLLHGCCDSYESWTRSTDLEELPGLDEVLVVMPDGGHVGFYSDWLEGSQGGPARWETFHLTELRQLLERDWRAGPRRAVAGLSMGGLGAMAYAARHPGMFQAAASYSGLLHTRYQGDPSSGARIVLDLLDAYGEDPAGLWGDPGRNAGVWAAHNPHDLAPRLRGVDLFVSVGDGRAGLLDGPTTSQQARQIEEDLHPQNLILQLGHPWVTPFLLHCSVWETLHSTDCSASSWRMLSARCDRTAGTNRERSLRVG